MDFDDGFHARPRAPTRSMKLWGEDLKNEKSGQLREKRRRSYDRPLTTSPHSASDDAIVKAAHHKCVWQRDRRCRKSPVEHIFLFRSDVVNNGIKIYDLKVKKEIVANCKIFPETTRGRC